MAHLWQGLVFYPCTEPPWILTRWGGQGSATQTPDMKKKKKITEIQFFCWNIKK